MARKLPTRIAVVIWIRSSSLSLFSRHGLFTTCFVTLGLIAIDQIRHGCSSSRGDIADCFHGYRFSVCGISVVWVIARVGCWVLCFMIAVDILVRRGDDVV